MVLESTRDIRTNIEADQQFTIAVTDSIFKTLSKRLYKYPIKAIIRELLSNAIDANLASNSDKKPVIHFPDNFDNIFYIEDFGVGMDESEIMSIYTQYGNSTKSDTNEFIGGLGLGSKTPFSYTDQFKVTSSKNGIKTSYLAYLDKDGIPSIKKLSSSECKASGTKIEMMVKSDDVTAFSRNAVSILLTSQILPEVINFREDISIEEIEAARAQLTTEGFVDLDNSFGKYLEYMGQAFLIMGGVCYSVNLDTVYGEGSFTWRAQSFLRNFGNTIIFNANIGDVSIQASREELFYDNKTIDFLREKLANYFMKTLEEYKSDKSSFSDRKLAEILNSVKSFYGTEDTVKETMGFAEGNLQLSLINSVEDLKCYWFDRASKMSKYSYKLLSLPELKNIDGCYYIKTSSNEDVLSYDTVANGFYAISSCKYIVPLEEKEYSAVLKLRGRQRVTSSKKYLFEEIGKYIESINPSKCKWDCSKALFCNKEDASVIQEITGLSILDMKIPRENYKKALDYEKALRKMGTKASSPEVEVYSKILNKRGSFREIAEEIKSLGKTLVYSVVSSTQEELIIPEKIEKKALIKDYCTEFTTSTSGMSFTLRREYGLELFKNCEVVKVSYMEYKRNDFEAMGGIYIRDYLKKFLKENEALVTKALIKHDFDSIIGIDRGMDSRYALNYSALAERFTKEEKENSRCFKMLEKIKSSTQNFENRKTTSYVPWQADCAFRLIKNLTGIELKPTIKLTSELTGLTKAQKLRYSALKYMCFTSFPEDEKEEKQYKDALANMVREIENL